MLGAARNDGAAGGERIGASHKIDGGVLLRLGQRLLLVLLDELGGGIDVLLRAVHGGKVKVSAPLRPPIADLNERRSRTTASPLTY